MPDIHLLVQGPARSASAGAHSGEAGSFAEGHLGDVAPVGEGVSELRIFHGPGYRVYFVQRGTAVILRCGGDKRSQDSDIVRAKVLAKEYAS
jgi:putative addiction module killer protein